MRRILCAIFIALFCYAQADAANRTVAFPQQQPSSATVNQQSRFYRLSFGSWMRDALGSSLAASGIYSNLSVAANGGMNIAVSPASNTLGTLYQLAVDDANPMPNGIWSPQLGADNTLIVVQATQSGPSSSIGPITAPTTSGQSQYYIVEGQVQTTDTTPASVNFINNQGQENAQSENTVRADQIVYQLKAGTAAASPTVPSLDSGWIGIATVLVPYGTSTITSGMISNSAFPPFGGFVANGASVTVNGLTLNGAGAGCVETNGSGVFEVDSCTSGLGSVSGTSPINASTSGGVATISCPTCVTGAAGTSPIAASVIGGVLGVSLTGVVPQAHGGTGQASLPTGFLYNNGTSLVSQTAVSSLTAGTGISVGSGSAPSVGLSHGDYIDASSAQTLSNKTLGAPTMTGSTLFSLSYSNRPLSSLPIQFNAAVGQTAIGPDSGVVVSGIPGSALSIGSNGAGVISIDQSGDLGVNQFLEAGAWGFFGVNQTNTLEIATSQTATVNGVTCSLGYYAWSGHNVVECQDTSGDIGISGTITAANGFSGSKRAWKEDIQPAIGLDALNILNKTDWAFYRYKPSYSTYHEQKIGFIADDTPAILAGPKHDHFDSEALSTVDAIAILQQQREIRCLYVIVGLLALWCFVLTVRRRHA